MEDVERQLRHPLAVPVRHVQPLDEELALLVVTLDRLLNTQTNAAENGSCDWGTEQNVSFGMTRDVFSVKQGLTRTSGDNADATRANCACGCARTFFVGLCGVT